MDTLRGYIARAEPEYTGEVGLADACVTLFQTLRAHRDCELDLDLSPAANARIPNEQKATLLLILREAISNALRHGGAKHIRVTLALDAGACRLSIRDDGQGCDFAAVPAPGQGLENIRARARELGGAPVFGPAPGGGVEVRVDWRPPSPPGGAA